MMKKADSRIVSGLIAAFAAASFPLYAQPGDNRATTIEEVIVTAQKVEESLQDTPVSVAAFSQEDLEKIGVSEAGDVANFTPNLTMRKQTASQDNYAIAIRGMSSGETALAVDPTVGIYHDGVYIARSTGAAFDIVDLQRIEVLRGPQGTLFGRNTIGGAINIITQKPKGELAFKQALSYGARDKRRYHTTIDSPAIGDFAAKLSFLRTTGDGQNESLYTGEDLGQYESAAIRLAVNWTPSDTFGLDYTYDKSDKENNPNTQQLSHVRPAAIPAGGAYFARAAAYADEHRKGKIPVRNTDDDVAYSDIDGHSVIATWDVIPELTIKWIGSYREWDSGTSATDFGSFPADPFSIIDTTGRFDSTIVTVPGVGPTPFVNPGVLVPIFDASRTSAQRQHSQEIQFISEAMEGKLRYIGGLYFFEEQANENNPQLFTVPTGTGQAVIADRPNYSYGTDNVSYAVFGQATYTFLTDLDVTLGLRYTIDEKETELTQLFGASVQSVESDDDWAHFNPSLTVDYRWNDSLSTYAKVTTGYRSGGYNVRASTIADFQKPYDEETVTSYEIGWKGDLLDRRLRLNGAIFRFDYKDRQIAQFSASGGGATTVIENAGESTTSGIEIDLVWLITQGLRVSASYGYLDLEYDEYITNRVDPITGVAVNPGVNEDIADTANENLYAPEHSGSVVVEYQFAPWSFGQLTLRADAFYTDEITFHPQFVLDESDDHHVVNARATLADIPVSSKGTLKISAWGKNLENKEYRDFGIDFGATLPFVTNTYAPLRSWGLDFIYEFNR